MTSTSPESTREIPSPHLIGYDLAECIKDIVEGKIDIQEVSEIRSNTKFNNLDKLADLFCYIYWNKYQEKAREVFLKLAARGKIIQNCTQPLNRPTWFDKNDPQQTEPEIQTGWVISREQMEREQSSGLDKTLDKTIAYIRRLLMQEEGIN